MKSSLKSPLTGLVHADEFVIGGPEEGKKGRSKGAKKLIVLANLKAVKTVLQGNPNDKNLKPVVTDFEVSEKFSAELAPYSFTVIRIKTK